MKPPPTVTRSADWGVYFHSLCTSSFQEAALQRKRKSKLPSDGRGMPGQAKFTLFGGQKGAWGECLGYYHSWTSVEGGS